MLETAQLATHLKSPVFLVLGASGGASVPFVLDQSLLIAWPAMLLIITVALWIDRRFIRSDATRKDLKVLQAQLHMVVVVLRAIARKSGVDDETMKELDNLKV